MNKEHGMSNKEVNSEMNKEQVMANKEVKSAKLVVPCSIFNEL